MESLFITKNIHMNIYKYFLIITTFIPYSGILFHYKTPIELVKGNQIQYIVDTKWRKKRACRNESTISG